MRSASGASRAQLIGSLSIGEVIGIVGWNAITWGGDSCWWKLR